MTMCRGLAVRLAWVIAALALLPTAAKAANTPAQSEAPIDVASCDLSFPHDHQPRDYRMRGQGDLKWALQDVNQFHYDPAMREIRAGRFTRNVIADLSYTLNWWPNHHAALQALITYEMGGGKFYEFRPTICFIERAKDIYPDDVNVRLVEAYYYWKRNDRRRAIATYEEVIAANPESADAHYNLGLVYLDMKEFEKAREHAKIAYDQGYPLAGLRNKLSKAGYPLSP